MKKITFVKKIFLVFSLLFIIFLNFIYAQEILFVGQGCPHCAKVEKYIFDNGITGVQIKEVYFNEENKKLFLAILKKLNIPSQDAGVPFLLVNPDKKQYFVGDKDIIKFFETASKSAKISVSSGDLEKNVLGEKKFDKWRFFAVLVPAALSDSINPCAFAVMLILLGSILCKGASRKKIILSGLLFILAVFISYFLMGMGVFHALASAKNTFYLKIGVGILGILVGLANLKDAFWYGKGFVMEVPFSWRPKLKKLLDSISSPLGAFFIGFLISLFLLPCTSGPYITILGFLASESSVLSHWGYLYLLVYNLIFVAPMFVITFLVTGKYCSTEYLLSKKENNIKLIHGIVGVLMLGLGIYVLFSAF